MAGRYSAIRLFSLLLRLSLVAPLVQTGRYAYAAGVDDPDALIAQGLKLRQSAQDRQALPLFQEALKKKTTPRALAQLGLCELALGLWVEADGHLKQALAAPADPWIRKNGRALKTAYDGLQEKLGYLDVWGEPGAARVAVDGQAVGTLPLEHPVRLSTGRHSMVVEATGFLSDNRFVDIPARAVAREHAALVPIPVTRSAPPPPSLALARPVAPEFEAAANVSAAPSESRKDDTAPSDPIYKRWWFWTVIGVALVGAGGAALLLSRKDHCESAGGGSCIAW